MESHPPRVIALGDNDGEHEVGMPRVQTTNHRVNRRTRAERFEIENLSRVPGYACRYPTDMNQKQDFESALSNAIERNDPQAIRRLAAVHSLEGSCVFDAWLSLASRLGKLDALGVLLDLATDINWANDDGETAFSYACAYNQCEAARLLYTRGANINTVDSSGGKPLDWAVCHCHPEFRQWLRSVGGERSLSHDEWPYPPPLQTDQIGG